MIARALLIGLVLLAPVGAWALPPYAINPAGTDALANGKLTIAASSDRAPINVPLLSTDPVSPADGDVWFVHNAPRHQGCARLGGTTRCWDANLTP